jgi:HPt (histidine-containing phosphotransfer) domain-containing protein
VPSLNFDAQRAANELGIPADIVNEFVQEFKEQINSHKIDFDNAIAADDIVGIKKTATLLKGMSDNLRLNEISEVLKGLQQTTDTNTTAQDLATLQAYADQL